MREYLSTLSKKELIEQHIQTIYQAHAMALLHLGYPCDKPTVLTEEEDGHRKAFMEQAIVQGDRAERRVPTLPLAEWPHVREGQ